MDDQTATITISFDFEIGWGDVTNGRWRAREADGVYDRLRKVLPRLLRELDAMDFPCTWATVGAMFEAIPDRQLDHVPALLLNMISSEIGRANESTFSGQDLFEMLINTNTSHQIACHSYTHVPWDHDSVDEKYIKEELKLFRDALARYDRSTDRIVFPENKEGYFDILAEQGFRVCRGNPVLRYRSRSEYVRRMLFDPPPLVVERLVSKDLRTQHASMLFNSGPRRVHRLPVIRRRFSLGLDSAIKESGSLHIWCHPFNFAESTGLLSSFLSAMAKVARLRDRGLIDIRPM